MMTSAALWIMLLAPPERPKPDPAIVAAGATVGALADWYAERAATPRQDYLARASADRPTWE